jgi:hypothetical protein
LSKWIPIEKIGSNCSTREKIGSNRTTPERRGALMGLTEGKIRHKMWGASSVRRDHRLLATIKAHENIMMSVQKHIKTARLSL